MDAILGTFHLEKTSVETNLIDFMKPHLKERINHKKNPIVVLHNANDGSVHYGRFELNKNGYSIFNCLLIFKTYDLNPGDNVEFVPIFGEIDEAITMKFKFYYAYKEQEQEQNKGKRKSKDKEKGKGKIKRKSNECDQSTLK